MIKPTTPIALYVISTMKQQENPCIARIVFLKIANVRE